MKLEMVLLMSGYIFTTSNVETKNFNHMKGVVETPNEQVAYHPGGKNETVGVKGTHVESDGLSLRRHTDEGGLVVFLTPNKYDEWSFSYTFSNAPLKFPHIGGVYLWYTSEIQDQGVYRGGHEVFNGVMVGLEFRGSQPEIVMAINDGESSYVGSEEMTLYRDTINPERLRGVHDITVKVISTHKNFKVELYDGKKLLYDSFRYHRRDDLADTSAGRYFNITSFYDKAPSESVYKLKEAQLFGRTETDEYEAHSVNAPLVEKTPRSADVVMHDDEEIRHLVAKVEYLNNYLHMIVGEPRNSSFDKVVNAVVERLKPHEKKIDNILSTLKSRGSSNVDTKLTALSGKIGELDIKLQKVQKTFLEMDHFLRSFKSDSNGPNILAYVIFGICASGFLFMVLREYKILRIRQKVL